MKSRLSRSIRLNPRFATSESRYTSLHHFPLGPRTATYQAYSTVIRQQGAHRGYIRAYLPSSGNIHCQTHCKFHSQSNQLQSSFAPFQWIIAAVLLSGGAYLISKPTSASGSPVVSLEDLEIMAATVPEGRPGNLTPEQEEKLRKLWSSVFQICDVTKEEHTSADASKAEAGKEADAPKKKRFGMFRSKKDKSGTAAATESGDTEDDKYGLSKAFQETLQNQSPEAIREAIWSMVKCDHPDALLLRFLRARKWDVEKALVMMISTMTWRMSEMHVDDDIMKEGEAGAVQGETATDKQAKTMGHDFMQQIRLGKSFLHGVDKQGRPICIVRVRLHRQGEQCEESLERYTVFIIETARMVLTPPVDTAVGTFIYLACCAVNKTDSIRLSFST